MHSSITNSPIDSFFQSLCKESKKSEILTLIESSPELLKQQDQRHGLTLLSHAVKLGRSEIVSLLLEAGADPNSQDLIGETPLHLAVDNSDWEIAEELLQYKAEPNCMTVDGETPLHHSAFIGDKKMINLLLSYGADPNCIDSTLGRTALHCAVQCEHIDCILLLLTQGADPVISDLEGKTPFECTENTEILEVLKDFQEKNIQKTLQSIPEVGTSEEEKNSYCYSFTSSDSLNFSLTSNSFLSLASDVPTQKYGTEDTTSSFQVGKWGEDPKLLKFLRTLKLMNYRDALISSGFDDYEMMVFQMTTPHPITHDMLELAGMQKHGHRARLLMKLEQQAAAVVRKDDRDHHESPWECCQPKTIFVPGVNLLKDWLAIIKMDKYQKLFEQAGYEDYQFMVSLMNSRYPVDDGLLCKIGIPKLGHRMRILAKLMDDAKDVQRKSISGRQQCILI
jgi:ankyrin repeat protein